jgi:hypothetical protein
MSEKRAVEKTMLTQARNLRNPGSPREWGERGIRASLRARRARARRPDSHDEAARNSLEADIALRDATNARKVPDELIAAAGEAIRPEFGISYLVNRDLLYAETELLYMVFGAHL